MKVGSLFSGIGGFDLGLERAGFEIEWQVENNDYCRKVLQKHWPKVPCHYDITTIDWAYIPRVDLICGGFPCQPFSCAGKQQGQDDDRYLWPEVVRCLAVLRPTWFLGENVYGLLHLGIEQVCADLEALGYQVAVLGIPACAVDVPHIRKRLWILAHTSCTGGRGGEVPESSRKEAAQDCSFPSPAESDLQGASRHDRSEALNGSNSYLADSISEQPERRRNGIERRQRSTGEVACNGRSRNSLANGGWPTEPNVGRVAHGIPARVDRLKGLGNAIVPQIAEALGRMILKVSR